jgi:hypothetical protein
MIWHILEPPLAANRGPFRLQTCPATSGKTPEHRSQQRGQFRQPSRLPGPRRLAKSLPVLPQDPPPRGSQPDVDGAPVIDESAEGGDASDDGGHAHYSGSKLGNSDPATPLQEPSQTRLPRLPYQGRANRF